MKESLMDGIALVRLRLRQSEILGLTWDCIDGNMLHTRKAVVMGEDGPVEKGGQDL